jgi:hypothetical protein
MSTPGEQHIAIAGEKLRQFLTLADDVLDVRQEIHERLDQRVEDFSTNLRNRVLVGLHLKGLDSFDRLLVDARERRAECSHHLKTMAESLIYAGWVSHDAGDTRAKLLYADGYKSKAAYHEIIGEQEMAAEWRKLQSHTLEGLECEFDRFQKSSLEHIAIQANRLDHYRQVYRLACEAAHLGDLFVYMPPQPEEPGLCFSDISLLRAYVCLKLSIILACDMLHDASDALGMSLDGRIEEFRVRWKEVIALQ